MTILTTTLNRIRAKRPCADGWRKLLAGLGKAEADDEPLPFAVILNVNGLVDAIWCLRVEPQHDREWRRLAVKLAREVQHLMPYRSAAALDVVERHANGLATVEELQAAQRVALSVAHAVSVSADSSTYTADVNAAYTAAYAAAARAAYAAAAVATAAVAAVAVAAVAAADAVAANAADARAAAREKQAEIFLDVVGRVNVADYVRASW